MKTTRFLQLSEPLQFLIRLCQLVNYGSILNVRVVDGNVCFESPPDVVIDVKLDSDVTQRREIDLADFALSAEVCRLMERFDTLKNCVIDRIEVRAGIPRRVLFRTQIDDLAEPRELERLRQTTGGQEGAS